MKKASKKKIKYDNISTYVKYPNRQSYRDRKRVSGCQGLGDKWRNGNNWKWVWGFFVG
jgi:hypothetical protein